MLSMVAPLYISEISPPEIRGALLVLEELSIMFGIVIGFWITFGTRDMVGEWAWRLPILLQLVPGLILGVGISFPPFSPRWLVSKGRDQEALHSLAKLRQLPTTDPRVQQEWYGIPAEVAFHKEVSVLRHPRLQNRSNHSRIKFEIASWVDCFKRGCWRRTHIEVGLIFFQQFVGINALISYDCLAYHHCHPGGTVLEQLGLPPSRSRGQRWVSALLHIELWCLLGPCPVSGEVFDRQACAFCSQLSGPCLQRSSRRPFEQKASHYQLA